MRSTADRPTRGARAPWTSRAALGVLMAATLAGCRARVASRPATVRATPWAEAPAGARFNRARVEVRYQPERRAGRAWSPARVEHWLVLAAGEREEGYALEAVTFRGGLARLATSAAEREFRALADASYTLRFAPDGHALALSTDGGQTFRYAALDAGEHPLYCRHRTLRAANGGDPFAGAPATRALVLEILASADPPTDPHSVHLYAGEAPALRDAFTQEALGAMRFACDHEADAELARAMSDALVRPGSQLQGVAVPDEIIACAGRLAARDEPARATLLHALGEADALRREQRQRALGVLLASRAAPAQEGIAEALSARLAATTECGDRGAADDLLALSEALARLTAAREGGSAATRAVFQRVAQMDECGGYRRVRAQRRRARLMALRGLVALHDAEADALIATLARGECARPAPPWPATPEAWAAQDESTGEFELACLARAAEQRNGSPDGGAAR